VSAIVAVMLRERASAARMYAGFFRLATGCEAAEFAEKFADEQDRMAEAIEAEASCMFNADLASAKAALAAGSRWFARPCLVCAGWPRHEMTCVFARMM
jgi:hypothetical protein